MPATATGVITRVGSVPVPVRDQDAALDFYTNILGFEKRMDVRFGEGYRWLTVAPPGGETQIVLEAGFGSDSGAPARAMVAMVLETDDIQGVYQNLAAKGVRFTEVPTLQPWDMWQAQFRDLDDNHYVLVQR
jgi:catechol 2,3-dioxygenase-like lactoylglutathione lyase family enzyme